MLLKILYFLLMGLAYLLGLLLFVLSQPICLFFLFLASVIFYYFYINKIN